MYLTYEFFLFSDKMRTPQRNGKGGSKQAGGHKKDLNKLRKRAMKSKMMKKTMFTLAGDDTKVCTEWHRVLNDL
jgi:hypothetical protein